MCLKEYKCKNCQAIYLAFEGEETRLSCPCENSLTWKKKFEKLFPMVRIVHTTDIFMRIQLDIIDSIHDLQEINIIRAGHDREVKQLNQYRKDL
jgi:hypothetical protein